MKPMSFDSASGYPSEEMAGRGVSLECWVVMESEGMSRMYNVPTSSQRHRVTPLSSSSSSFVVSSAGDGGGARWV